jgi:hypothetical protein
LVVALLHGPENFGDIAHVRLIRKGNDGDFGKNGPPRQNKTGRLLTDVSAAILSASDVSGGGVSCLFCAFARGLGQRKFE